MKKSHLLTAILLMLNINAFSQSQCGLQQYYYLNDAKAFTLVPVAYYQNRNHWYFEGRYNYEALNCMSVYAGKIWEKKGSLSYAVNPVAGLVMGSFKGGSAGVNIRADYKKYSFSTQAQYTFSAVDRRENFIYSWNEVLYNASGFLSAGLCLQHTRDYNTENKYDKGAFIKFRFSQWSFPFYIFKKNENEKYFVLSINYEWTYTSAFNNRKNSINKTRLR